MKTIFNKDNVVNDCSVCPLQPYAIRDCLKWVATHNDSCPTVDTYQESVEYAKQINEKIK